MSPSSSDPARAAVAASVRSPRWHTPPWGPHPHSQEIRHPYARAPCAVPVVCVALVSRDIIKSSYFGCFLYPAAPSDAAAGSSPLSLKQALALNVSPVDIHSLWGPVVFEGGTRRGLTAHVSWGVGKQQEWEWDHCRGEMGGMEKRIWGGSSGSSAASVLGRGQQCFPLIKEMLI